MMIVMKEGASRDDVDAVIRRVESVGAKAHVSEGEIHCSTNTYRDYLTT